MRILITGATGKLGRKIADVLGQSHQIIGTGSAELDITDFTAVKHYVQHVEPELIINAAAWTHVDGCALEPEKAIVINGIGAQNLAIAAHEHQIGMMQISSNEVFDGNSSRLYREYDAPHPVNPYGYSKYFGEKAVRDVNPRHYIVRTSWLFAHGGHNFIHSILNAAKQHKTLRVVTDEVANPTYNDDLVIAISQLIDSGRYGTYHLCNEGAVSRYAFARYALDQAGLSATPIEAISRYEWQRPSQPPTYTGMQNIMAKQLGIQLRSWQAAVQAFLRHEGLLVEDEQVH